MDQMDHESNWQKPSLLNIIIVSLSVFFIVVIIIMISILFSNPSCPNDVTVEVETDLEDLEEREGATLVHISSKDESLLKVLNNFNMNEIISVTNLSISEIYNMYSYNPLPSTYWNNKNPNSLMFDQTSLLQGYSELKHKGNYNGVSLMNSIPISDLKYIYDATNDSKVDCYLRKYKRNIDHIEYYFAQINIKKSNSLNDITAASSFYSILTYLNDNYPGEYIFTGNFGVHGFKNIFSSHFDFENNYHVLPSLPTSNDAIGIYNTNGIMISKSLYKQVFYKVKLYPGHNNDSFHTEVKMFNMRDQLPGTFNITSPKIFTFIHMNKNNILLGKETGRRLFEEPLYDNGDLIQLSLSETSDIQNIEIFTNLEHENYKIVGLDSIATKLDSLHIINDE